MASLPCDTNRLRHLECGFERLPVHRSYPIDTQPDCQQYQSRGKLVGLCCGNPHECVFVNVWTIPVDVDTYSSGIILVRKCSTSCQLCTSFSLPKVVHTEYIALLLKVQTTLQDACHRQKLRVLQSGVQRTVLVDHQQRAKLIRALP
jgi:hypothetical protein